MELFWLELTKPPFAINTISAPIRLATFALLAPTIDPTAQ
jgi:hypothetical protein